MKSLKVSLVDTLIYGLVFRAILLKDEKRDKWQEKLVLPQKGT